MNPRYNKQIHSINKTDLSLASSKWFLDFGLTSFRCGTQGVTALRAFGVLLSFLGEGGVASMGVTSMGVASRGVASRGVAKRCFLEEVFLF